MAKTTVKNEEVVAPVPEEDNDLRANLEDFMNEGFEDSKRSVMSYPLLKICQPQDTKLTEEDTDLRPGCLMDNNSGKNLGKTLDVIVYRHWAGKCKMPPRSEGTSPVCFSMNKKLGSRGTKCSECEYASGPDFCKEQQMFLVAPVDSPDTIYRVTMWKSSVKIGRAINKALTETGRNKKAPLYAIVLTLSSEVMDNKETQSKYYVYKGVVKEVLPMAKAVATYREHFLDATEVLKESLDEFVKRSEEAAANLAKEESESADFAEGLGSQSNVNIEADTDQAAAKLF